MTVHHCGESVCARVREGQVRRGGNILVTYWPSSSSGSSGVDSAERWDLEPIERFDAPPGESGPAVSSYAGH